MRLELAPKAAADIEEIGDFIAQDNPIAAEALVDRFWAEIDLIEQRPMLFRTVEGLPIGFRSALVGQYRILFRTQGDLVRIERVLHGMRDLSRHLS